MIWTPDNFKKWFFIESLPSVIQLNSRTYRLISKRNLPILWLVAENQKDIDANHFKELADKYKGKITFVSVDKKQFYVHFTDYVRLSTTNLPIYICSTPDKRRYLFPGDEVGEKQERLEQWLSNILSDHQGGKMASRAGYKSESIPFMENEHYSVMKLVGLTFSMEAHDPTMFVLVKFDTPGCVKCQKLNNLWIELGNHFGGNDDIVIAKIDTKLNDFPDKTDI
eukprot:UN28653